MAHSLAVMALAPEAATSPEYQRLVDALQKRFGARQVTLVDTLTDGATALGQQQALVVYLDRAIPETFWAAHPERVQVLRQADRQHMPILPLATLAVGMPPQATLPPDLAQFSRRQLLDPELVARGEWSRLAERIAELLAIQYDYRWARFLVWAGAIAPFASAFLISLVFAVDRDLAQRAYFVNATGVRGTLSEYVWVLLKDVPTFPQLMVVVCSPLLITLGLWHLQAARLRQWQTLVRFALADALLFGGALLVFVDWAQGYRQNLASASVAEDTFVRNIWLIILLLAAGTILAVSSFLSMSWRIVRPVREKDLVHLTLRTADRTVRDMDTDIFVSYRRADSGAATQAIMQPLARHYRVFRDAETILAGADFDHIIRQALYECHVVLAVIGPTWTTVRAANGIRRLEDPQDYVRLELATAIRDAKVIIPILVGNAQMPLPHEVPPELRPLTNLQPIRIPDSANPAYLQPLVATLRELLRTKANIPLQIVTRAITLWSIISTFLIGIEVVGLFTPVSRALGLCLLNEVWLGDSYCTANPFIFEGSSDTVLLRNLAYTGFVLFVLAWAVALVMAVTRYHWDWLRRNSWVFIAGIVVALWFYFVIEQRNLQNNFTVIYPDQYVVTVLLIAIGALSLRVLTRYSQGIQRIRYTSQSQVK